MGSPAAGATRAVSPLHRSRVSGHWGPERILAPSDIWTGGGKGTPKLSQSTITSLLCLLANGVWCNNHRKKRLIKDSGGPQKG